MKVILEVLFGFLNARYYDVCEDLQTRLMLMITLKVTVHIPLQSK